MKKILSSIKRIYRKFNVALYRGRHLRSVNVDEGEDHICLNCGTHFKGKICPHCGQSGNTKRVTLTNIVTNFKDNLTSMNFAIVRTFIQLIYRPGYMVRDYLCGHRKEYMNPISLIFSIVLIEGVLEYLWPEHDGGSTADMGNGFLNFLNSHDEIEYTLIGIVVSLPLWITYKWTKWGKSTNLAESCYFCIYLTCFLIIMLDIILYTLPLFMPYISEEDKFDNTVLYGIPIWCVYVYVATKQFYKLEFIKSILLYALFLLTNIVYFALIFKISDLTLGTDIL